MNLVSEQALYRKINLLRFVAIVCVLIAHSENYEQFGFLSGTLAFQVEHDVLASCEWVVSSFFMLSAMLFFRRFQWNQLLGKWKRRVQTLLVPYLLSAIRMYESGFATAEDIDKAIVLGLAHPMGPLKLTDLIGLDTVKFIADAMYEEYKEPLYAAPPLLLRMVEAGYKGKKAGRGFFEYPAK